VYILSLYLGIFAVPSPQGAFGGLGPQTKLQAPYKLNYEALQIGGVIVKYQNVKHPKQT